MLESKVFYNYSLVVFDLDDTLYKETDYLFSAYHEIEQYVSRKAHIPFDKLSGFLKTSFLSRGREGLFDVFLSCFGIEGRVEKSEMLEILRTHTCTLSLYPQSESLLAELHKSGRGLAILTNGNLIQQKNKIRCLNLCETHPYIDVVYAAEVGTKPSPNGLFVIAERNKIDIKKIAFVGDSRIDEETSKNAGVDFYYIDK